MNNISFNKLGVMIDCSRNAVMSVPTLKRWIDITASLGYNMLMLYTEDTYEVDNQPYFGYLRGRYSQKELREIDDYAFKHGMELIPAIQTLAHLKSIFRWPAYIGINDCEDILLAGDENTYKLIDDIFASLEKTLRTRVVNIGMDEAHMLGRGEYQRIHGAENRFDILLNHLKRVAQIAEKHGFECIMWGDMFFRLLGGNYYEEGAVPERVKKMIPHNVNLIYWDYYSTDKEHYLKQIESHSAIKDNIWFAGGLWSWTGFAPHNAYSIDATKAAFHACKEKNIKNVFVTMWGDNGAECSKFSLLPSLYYAAQAARGTEDTKTVKNGFSEKFGIDFDDFMLADLPGTANEQKDGIVNPEKYMLYNDCLLGMLDSTVREGDGEKYAECAAKLKGLEENQSYGYIFKTLRTLCEVLSVKFDIGVRTRKAYKNRDTAALRNIIADYKRLLELIDNFYNAFKEQWERENKPNGFEVQDIRIGGLVTRVRHCMNRLEAFADGRLSELSELEEPILDFTGAGERLNCKPIRCNNWGASASVDL